MREKEMGVATKQCLCSTLWGVCQSQKNCGVDEYDQVCIDEQMLLQSQFESVELRYTDIYTKNLWVLDWINKTYKG